jgi:hypothetical protein
MKRAVHNMNNGVRDIHHKLVKKLDAYTIHFRGRYSFLKAGQVYGGLLGFCKERELQMFGRTRIAILLEEMVVKSRGHTTSA